MTTGAISASLGAPDAGMSAESLKRSHAASDFESLLISQMLKSIRTEGSGWLGTGDDQASEAAFGLGEEQLAKALSTSGGFGLSKLIESGLRAREKAANTLPPSPAEAETL